MVDAINAVSEDTGIVASLNGEGNIQLIAEDGRNIAIEATGTASNLGFIDGTVQGGTLTLECKHTYTLQCSATEVATDALGGITVLGESNLSNFVYGGYTSNNRAFPFVVGTQG